MSVRLLSVAAATLCAVISQANADDNDAMAQCAQIDDGDARLACFDAVMSRRSGATREDDAPAPAPAPVADGAAAPVADGGAAPDATPAPMPAPPAAATQSGEEEFVTLPKADVEALRRQAARNDNARGDRPEPPREPYESRIIRVFTTGYKIPNVALENGETWRQFANTGGMRPKRGETARIAPAAFGGWTIQYGDRGAKYKVRRVE